MMEYDSRTISKETETEGKGLDLLTFTKFLDEIAEQPAWRSRADKEMDYYDGNQLDSAILRAQAEVGMPPAIEPIIGPTIDAVLGLEVKTRADWRVVPDSDKAGDDIALGINRKLNLAERQSKADEACSEAFKSEISVGLGWVEVSKESDPFKFPYRCKAIHRNEIWWDWSAREPDLSDARYLVRRKWTDRDLAKLLFPKHADLIEASGTGWYGVDIAGLSLEGGTETGLAMAHNMERGWSIEEQEWRDISNRRVCLFEVWYRIWERVVVIKTPDGRVVEYDENNMDHVQVVALGHLKPISAIISRMRRAWYLGPHQLYDGPSPYAHNRFPYVPFWGKIEDRTRSPYGIIRGMIYLQDEVNARISRMQWGLASVRTIRTEGAVKMDDNQFHNEIGRADCDIVLDAKEMAKQGAMFEIDRDFDLNIQQAARLADARESIQRVSNVSDPFTGADKVQRSGIAQDSLVEQSTQSLADMHDNFKSGRSLVGDILMSLIIEDMGSDPQEIFIPGEAIKEDKTVFLNTPTTDEHGVEYLDNDIQRTKLKVVLTDVASTPSFRHQQLNALSEVVKSLPSDLQTVVTPYLLALMDLPDREEIIKAIKEASYRSTPEEVAEQIEVAVKEALERAGIEAKLIAARGKEKVDTAKAIEIGVSAAMKAVETAKSIAEAPSTVDVADSIIDSAAVGLDVASMPDEDEIPDIPPAPAEELPKPGEGEITQ
jgi:hypothetical protein